MAVKLLTPGDQRDQVDAVLPLEGQLHELHAIMHRCHAIPNAEDNDPPAATPRGGRFSGLDENMNWEEVEDAGFLYESGEEDDGEDNEDLYDEDEFEDMMDVD